MTQAEATPDLLSVIQSCHLMSSVRTWGNTDVLRAWRGLYKSATTFISQIPLAHDINMCEAQDHGEICAATYALLKEIDDREHLRTLIYIIVDRTSFLL